MLDDFHIKICFKTIATTTTATEKDIKEFYQSIHIY